MRVRELPYYFFRGLKIKHEYAYGSYRDIIEDYKWYLWGNKIAEFKPVEGILILDDCGYKTPTTYSRLRYILEHIRLPIYIGFSKNKMYVRDWEANQTLYDPRGKLIVDLSENVIKLASGTVYNYYTKEIMNVATSTVLDIG